MKKIRLFSTKVITDIEGEGEKMLEAIKALEQEPRKITYEDVKGYCKPRCLTIIDNELLYELTHPKIKALEQEPFINKPCISEGVCHEDKVKVLDKIRAEIEQLPTKTRTNWDGCCPDIDYPEIEYVDVTKNKLLSIIDKYKAESEDKNECVCSR